MARTQRPHHGAGALVLLALVLGACGGAAPAVSPNDGAPSAASSSAGVTSPSGPTAPSGAAPGGSDSAPAGSASAAGSGATAGGTVDFCKLFTESEMSKFLGRPAHLGGTRAATTPDNCTWQDDNLTTVWVLRSTPDECASDKDAIGSDGGAYPGADFAGPSPLGAMFAGVVSAGSCFEVEVSPTERSPKPEALAGLLQQFVQRAGA